jgi:high affinity sulfate transporter 1
MSAPEEPAASASPEEPRARPPARLTAPPPPLPTSGLAAWLPGLAVLRGYRRAWLGRDIGAGLVLTTLLVPAGMGYAEASGLPAVTGLYATVGPLLAYAVFGPSRILVLGPDSALAALIGAAVLGSSGGDPSRVIGLASLLAVLTGLLCVAAGFAKAGFVTDLLSKPVRVGYMNGIALTILVTQLPKLFGFSVKASGVVDGSLGFARGLLAGRTNPTAIVVGGGCLALILVLRAAAPKVPGILIAVVLATLGVTLLHPAGLVVVGPVPRGIPLPSVPHVHLEDVGPMFIAAVGIALVSFADASVLSRTYAARYGYRVDPNRELLALGIANLTAGVFRGFPVSASASRTPVAESAGARTQMTGVVGALAILVLLVAAPGLLQNLPMTALAAVVISAAIHMFDVASLRVFRRVRRSDFALSILAFVAVAVLGVIPGIAAAIGLSLLEFVRRAWRPHDAILGRAEGVKGYHDLARYPAAKQVPGLLLFRWDAPLFFANADMFRRRLLEALDGSVPPARWVVVAAEPITDVDSTAAEIVAELDEVLTARGVELAFAELKDPVKDRLNRYGLKAKIGQGFFFPTLGVAVKAFLTQNEVGWTDWEEESKRGD